MSKHGAGGRTWHEVDDIPTPFIDYLQSNVHTGRGTGHQIATTDTIVPALAATPEIKALIAADRICYFAGAKHGRGQRNRDLVLGVPPKSGALWDDAAGMLRAMPTRVVASGEYKSIMTELGKNAGNRRDDLQRHARASRDHGVATVAFGVCPVNAANSYYSYTAKVWRDVRPDGKTAAAKAVDTLREVVTGRAEDSLHVLWTPVVVANNDPDATLRTASWLRAYPQPADGDELGWGHFINTLAHRIALDISNS